MRASTINANDQLMTAAEYRDLVIAYKNGSPVRLSDVANAIDGAQNDKLAAWMNMTPAVILNVQRQPGANVIEVVDNIKSLLPQLTASLPAAVDVSVLTDRTVTIRASVEDVEFELMLAVVLVVLVIFVFLRSARATIIPSLSVPLSLVGTFGAMYMLGFSLNNLSLMALTISSGFVVDDAIVVIEKFPATSRKASPRSRPRSRFRADRVHDYLADDFVDRSAHSAAVHGRRGRPAIPRICDHACGHDPDLRRRLADPRSMACAKLLKPAAEEHENAFQRRTRLWFDALIDGYAGAAAICT